MLGFVCVRSVLRISGLVQDHLRLCSFFGFTVNIITRFDVYARPAEMRVIAMDPSKIKVVVASSGSNSGQAIPQAKSKLLLPFHTSVTDIQTIRSSDPHTLM
jgi:hypothetical protein